MRTYRTKSPISFGQGDRLQLTDAQIEPRAINLKVVEKKPGGAIIEAVSVLQFKANEIIGLPSVPKRLAESLEAIERPKAAKSLDKALV